MTLNKSINAILLFLLPFLMSWTQRSKIFSIYTKEPFLSKIVQKCVWNCVREHFSFAEIIHPPHRSGISRCWLVGVDIAHLSLRLATVKGHSETRSFALLGGSGGGRGVSGVTTICLTYHLRIELLKEVEYIHWSRSSQTHSGWPVLVGMLVMQELGCFQLPGVCTDSCSMGLCVIPLQSWGDGRGWI